MNLFKSLWVAAAVMAVALAEPALPGQFQYLPPKTTGYTYSTPNVPFVTPSTTPYYRPPPSTTPYYRPTPPPPPPPTTQPPYEYTTQYQNYRTTTTPRPYTPPRDYGPPVEHHHEHGHGHVHEPGMPFDFAYAVKDDVHGSDYQHRANSNGDVVQGEYRVALPDGRIQLVRYTADWATGFHAEVTYEGTAVYPSPRPGPVYGPAQQTGY